MDSLNSRFNARILIVDDYIVNQELVKEILEIMGCTVDVAESGQEAIVKFESNEYDLIFMDIQMPNMDGCETSREIRKKEKEGKRVPIIALTANVLPGDKEKYMQEGMDDYISKPIKGKELEAILKKYGPKKVS